MVKTGYKMDHATGAWYIKNSEKKWTKIHIWTRIGVFAWGQILGISPNGLHAGHCDAPRIMSAVNILVEVLYWFKGYLMLYYPYM